MTRPPQAEEAFVRLFQKGDVPDTMEEHRSRAPG